MKDCETQGKLLSATISPSEAVSLTLIDGKSNFNYQKLTLMTKSLTDGPNFESFNVQNQIKKELSRVIERSNSCMKCGNALTKGHLNVCPAQRIFCKTYRRNFAKLCKSRNKLPSVNIVSDNHVNIANSVPPEKSWSDNQEMCGVINTWNGNGPREDDNVSVWSVRTISTRTDWKLENSWT